MLGAVELVARLVLPFPLGSGGTYQNFDDVVYFHRPASKGHEVSPIGEFRPVELRYDRHGFRGDGEQPPQAGSFYAILGDSFVEARQVPERQSVAGLLGAGDPASAFINAGCSAYTTTTSYLLLKSRVLPLKPKAVIFFFTFNDYRDNFVYGGGYFRHPDVFSTGAPKSWQPQAGSPGAVALLAQYSAVFANLQLALSRPVIPRGPLETRATLNRFEQSFMAVNKPTGKLDGVEREVLEFTHRGLAEMAALARAGGARFVIFIIPLPTQVGPAEWVRGKVLQAGVARDFVERDTTYQERLMDFCRSGNIECIDLLPAFRAAGRERRLFFDYDGHWNAAGNRTAAFEVARAFAIDRSRLAPIE